MPRKAKQPYAGKANRTDLLTPPAQPVRVATGQPYGEAKAMTEAQQAAPVPDNQAAFAAAIAAATKLPPPPAGGLTRPTERPDQPITAGIASGPGPGPEAINMGAPRVAVADTLRMLAAATGDPTFDMLAAEAEGL